MANLSSKIQEIAYTIFLNLYTRSTVILDVISDNSVGTNWEKIIYKNLKLKFMQKMLNNA